MWESVLKKEQFELQIHPRNKTIQIQVSNHNDQERPFSLQLGESELFELMHAFLTINRSFNREAMYYDKVPNACSSELI